MVHYVNFKAKEAHFLSQGLVAAERVFYLLGRKPKIDTDPSAGLKLPEVSGEKAKPHDGGSSANCSLH